MTTRRRLFAAATTVAVTAMAGCGTYYKVTDVQTNTDYYTTKVDHMKSGEYRFVDESNGQTVRLEKGRVLKVTSGEYWKHVPEN